MTGDKQLSEAVIADYILNADQSVESSQFNDAVLVYQDVLSKHCSSQGVMFDDTPVKDAIATLSALGDFSVQELSQVFNCSENAVTQAIDESQAFLTPIKTSCLIISDRPEETEYLRNVMEELGHIVLPAVSSLNEATELIRVNRPRAILVGSGMIMSVLTSPADWKLATSQAIISFASDPKLWCRGRNPEPTIVLPSNMSIRAQTWLVTYVLSKHFT